MPDDGLSFILLAVSLDFFAFFDLGFPLGLGGLSEDGLVARFYA